MMDSASPETKPARRGQKTGAAASLCPICHSKRFRAADRTVNLDTVMQRWVDTGARLKPETIHAYSHEVHGDLRLYTCPNCGFGRFQPVVVGDPAFYSAITEVNYYNTEKWEFDRARTIVLAAHARSVIDVGCGSGLFLQQIRKHAESDVSLTGVELNESAAEKARAQGLAVHVSNYTENQFADLSKADVVCAFQVLEHVADPLGFLTGLKQLTQPGGLVLIGVPDTEGLISRHWDALTELPPHHVTYWTEKSLTRAFKAIGLELVQMEREPLSKVLWEGYFPDVWSDGAWPSKFGRAVAKLAGEVGDGMPWVSRTLSSAGMTALFGVGGHTMLAVGRPSPKPDRALTSKSNPAPRELASE